jgi:lysyl-tRNA synthetase class 2
VTESSHEDWRPTATRERLEQRAALLARTRAFFAGRGVLEVDTPAVVNAAVTDVHIHSAEVHFPDDGAHGTKRRFFLHTSPEYAMKRLLAAGSGPIYQICHVVRGLERGRLHNPEFTLIEWYRPGFTLEALMDEVEQLARALLGARAESWRSERITYREAFLREVGVDPLDASIAELARAARTLGFAVPDDPGATDRDEARDELLDLLMGLAVGPRLGHDAFTFVHRYPASQAALARLDPDDPRVALRFELYCAGIELANGFHELGSAAEQRARFEHDRRTRERRGLPVHDIDERLLAALEAGLPDCAGVALGFDRLLMLACGAGSIDEVLPFPTERA